MIFTPPDLPILREQENQINSPLAFAGASGHHGYFHDVDGGPV